MRQFILYFGFFFIISLSNTLNAQMLWEEHFDIPGKGVWADSLGFVFSDFSEVEWTLDTGGCTFADENDYAKTVSTSGGRFEVLDSDGEVKWYSPVIDIENYDAVNISFTAQETGSSTGGEKKYVKAFYIVDGASPVPFSPDSTAAGNWGGKLLEQEGLKGESLQLLICLNSSYANDKVIIDDVVVEGIDSSLLLPSLIKIVEAPAFAFTGEVFQIKAGILNSLEEFVADPDISLKLEGDGFVIISETFSEGIYSWDVQCVDAGAVSFIFFSEIYDIDNAFGEITVYDLSGRIVWENFENNTLENWETEGQWKIDSAGAIAGNYSVRHIEQEASGVSVLSYNRLEDEITFGASELLFSFKTVNGNWNPSSSNYFCLRVGDEQFIRGLAIGVNASGSTDLVSVWEIESGEAVRLLAETGFKWNENTTAQIELLIQPAGICNLSVTDLDDYRSEESSFNFNQTVAFQKMEMLFGFSKTRSGQLWLDDFLVVEKNTAPVISGVEVIDEGILKVTFNEPVSGAGLHEAGFSLAGDDFAGFNINRVEAADSVTVFIYAEGIEGLELVLSAFNIEDMQATINPVSTYEFQYLLPVELYDVVFTEIMADPSPPVGLPEVEFLEVFNLSEKYIDIEGWELSVNTKVYSLPGKLLLPGAYTVVCNVPDTALFEEYGNVCGLEKFPSLLNSEAYLKLSDSNGLTVDELTYSGDWYADNEKDDGGWSLEKIDPSRNCGNSGNWLASTDQSGGTPGRKNSVYAENTDLTAPFLGNIEVLGPNEIELTFSEPVDSLSILNPGNISVEGLDIAAVFPGEDGVSSIFSFGRSVEINHEYGVAIKNLSDECGNIAPEQTGKFSLIALQPGDVVINEVLFNPFADGFDFVELYNCSGLTLDLSKLHLATRNDTLGLRSVYRLTDKAAPFYDKTLLAFTADSENILANYPVLYPENIVQVERLPAYNNDEGRVVLLDDSLTILDELAYSESMHSTWLNDYNGVSLERVSVEAATNSATNWRSASSLCGWATPGYENSQLEIEEETTLEVFIEPDAISPNDDGYHDELVITFQLDQPDYLANVYVFSASGREVNRLLNNQLPGNGSAVTFDGRDVNGILLKPGIYVLLTELFHLSGAKKTFKHAFLVTDRL